MTTFLKWLQGANIYSLTWQTLETFNKFFQTVTSLPLGHQLELFSQAFSTHLTNSFSKLDHMKKLCSKLLRSRRASNLERTDVWCLRGRHDWINQQISSRCRQRPSSIWSTTSLLQLRHWQWRRQQQRWQLKRCWRSWHQIRRIFIIFHAKTAASPSTKTNFDKS